MYGHMTKQVLAKHGVTNPNENNFSIMFGIAVSCCSKTIKLGGLTKVTSALFSFLRGNGALLF